MQRVHFASDHAGFELKEVLARAVKDLGHEVIDHGTFSKESCDYPVFAHKLCDAVEQDACPGILICGTGIGMSIAANRHPGIRAALCGTELHARLARRHNNANVLCLGSRVTGVELALAIMTAFLESSFENGRHQRRLDQLNIPCRGF
ncbi:ribose 5-phosphate isomerase B [Desulfovibrio sp. ZJ369]|uniref:ribose 5-phosphate isomerase B n=1 Tax=Desulfovibrio sp. ZJ369 TaxID=2709793 RepID=UPI0013EC8E6A|nr:ribose 5-phosphate isomerase B [Desulfovibrio sp. ZJ369]